MHLHTTMVEVNMLSPDYLAGFEPRRRLLIFCLFIEQVSQIQCITLRIPKYMHGVSPCWCFVPIKSLLVFHEWLEMFTEGFLDGSS